jgi:hypothetical protein
LDDQQSDTMRVPPLVVFTSNTDGTVYPGEHQGIVSHDLWGGAHTILTESPRTGANRNRAQSAVLPRGLIFGTDGRASRWC